MNMKRFLLINSCALALLGASAVSANAPADVVNAPVQKQGQCRHHFGKMLSPEQRTELRQIMQGMRAQMTPLIKEKRALKLQIMGKIATPNTQWGAVAGLVEQSNANDAKIATLIAKTRFQTYQKLGVMLPFHHHHHRNFARK